MPNNTGPVTPSKTYGRGTGGVGDPRPTRWEWRADGTSACACYRETVAGGRHIGVCLLQGDSGRRTAQRRVPATGRQLTGGRHNGVCLLHGDTDRRTAQRRVPATRRQWLADGTGECACYHRASAGLHQPGAGIIPSSRLVVKLGFLIGSSSLPSSPDRHILY